MFSKKTHYPLPKDLQKIVIDYYLDGKETETRDITLTYTKIIGFFLVMLPLLKANIEKNWQSPPNQLKVSGYFALTVLGGLFALPGVCITLPIDGVIDSSKKIRRSIKKKSY